MAESTDQGRAATAAAIRKVLLAGPTRRTGYGMFKRKKDHSPKKIDRRDQIKRLASQVVEGMAAAGFKPVAGLRALASGAFNGVGDDATAAIRKAVEGRPQFDTPDDMWLRKVALPGQSQNAMISNALAGTGATNLTARQPMPSEKPTMFGPRQAQSLSDGKPPPEDPTLTALKAIFKAGPKRGP